MIAATWAEPASYVDPMFARGDHGAGELAFFSMTPTLGTPVDITVAELTVESFFPADSATAAVLHVRPQ